MALRFMSASAQTVSRLSQSVRTCVTPLSTGGVCTRSLFTNKSINSTPWQSLRCSAPKGFVLLKPSARPTSAVVTVRTQRRSYNEGSTGSGNGPFGSGPFKFFQDAFYRWLSELLAFLRNPLIPGWSKALRLIGMVIVPYVGFYGALELAPCITFPGGVVAVTATFLALPDPFGFFAVVFLPRFICPKEKRQQQQRLAQRPQQQQPLPAYPQQPLPAYPQQPVLASTPRSHRDEPDYPSREMYSRELYSDDQVGYDDNKDDDF
eukprot:TRINITY_DN1299_c0_g1_i1.p1 TRINITY_DN1299_c0_g1~~TRINITY_DN1299_c0_g1_i1.p1  ORF type:complete len:263 (+),score=41.42 TRINITY_DN1299_c0_g1_i1:182-970(+)